LLQNLDEVHSFFRDLASAGTGIGTHHNLGASRES
jgi:hypothetical protein